MAQRARGGPTSWWDDSARPSGSSQPLERHLRRARGVVEASFNLGTMEVRIEYVPGATDVASLRRAIEEFGYRVREQPAGTDDMDARAPTNRPRRSCCSCCSCCCGRVPRPVALKRCNCGTSCHRHAAPATLLKSAQVIASKCARLAHRVTAR